MRKKIQAICILLLFLSGCAGVFGPRTDRERRAECLGSWLCTAIERNPLRSAGPVALDYSLTGVNGEANCMDHSSTAAARLHEMREDVRDSGIGRICVVGGTAPIRARDNCPEWARKGDDRCGHAVVAVEYRGSVTIIDNGALRGCGRLCSPAKARKSGFEADLNRSYGEACSELTDQLRQPPTIHEQN